MLLSLPALAIAAAALAVTAASTPFTSVLRSANSNRAVEETASLHRISEDAALSTLEKRDPQIKQIAWITDKLSAVGRPRDGRPMSLWLTKARRPTLVPAREPTLEGLISKLRPLRSPSSRFTPSSSSAFQPIDQPPLHTQPVESSFNPQVTQADPAAITIDAQLPTRKARKRKQRMDVGGEPEAAGSSSNARTLMELSSEFCVVTVRITRQTKLLNAASPGSAEWQALQAKLASLRVQQAQIRAEIRQLKERVDKDRLDGLDKLKNLWREAEQRLAHARTLGLSGDALSHLVANAREKQIMFDMAASAHPLEADALSVREQKRSYNKTYRSKDLGAFRQLAAVRQKAYRDRQRKQSNDAQHSGSA